MNQTDLLFFRVVFGYMELDSEGKVVKAKKEVIITAVNYTDAESVAMEIANDLRTYSDEVIHKITWIDKKIEILLTSVFQVNNNLTRGLVNCYLEGEERESGVYSVIVAFSDTNDRGKKKISKETLFLAADTNKKAYEIAEKYLRHVETRDFNIKDIKFDNADEIFVTQDIYKSLVAKSEDALLL